MRSQRPCYTVPVARLTLTIDDELLRRARRRALAEVTSVVGERGLGRGAPFEVLANDQSFGSVTVRDPVA